MSFAEAQEEAAKLDQAAGGVDEVEEDGEEGEDGEEEEEGAVGGEKKNLEIDESLFTLDDLGNIQDELEDLDIS